MSSTSVNTPLSDDDYEQLDTLLAAPEFGGRAMSVSSLEGYLTAIVISPTPVAPNRWLSQVWDMSGQPPDLSQIDAEQAKRIMALVMRHYQYMIAWMDKDPGSLEPIYECGPQWSAREWCQGFLLGTQHDAAWEQLRAAQPALFHPLVDNADSAASDADGDGVVRAVLSMHAHWKPRTRTSPALAAGIQQPSVRDTPKVGRNDPCPCGSGKKFKKCCDAAA
jgi:uncharacterized protein